MFVCVRRREEFFELTKNSRFVWEDEGHRDLLRSVLLLLVSGEHLEVPETTFFFSSGQTPEL